jgi:hypothetical protein
MVEYITGNNGIGKTKLLIEAATATALSSKGNVVFIDCTNKLNLVIPSSIRLINPKDYGIKSARGFYGFLVGLCANDYDLTDVFVDSTLDFFSDKSTNIDDFMDIIKNASSVTGVNFYFSIRDEYEKELVYQSVSA